MLISMYSDHISPSTFALSVNQIKTSSMKNRKKLFTAVIALFTMCSVSYGQVQNTSAFIKPQSDMSFALYLNEIDFPSVKISIKDDEGRNLYTKTVKNEASFAKKFDMSQLPQGAYILSLEDEQTVQNIPLSVVDNNVQIDMDAKTRTYKPVFKQDSDILDVMVFSPAQLQHQITIYDDANQVVYNETIDGQTTIEKRYNLANLAPGQYNVTIESNDLRYSYLMPID
jgi:hypothetical protein